jgi:biopolymer transport protein ExbD
MRRKSLRSPLFSDFNTLQFASVMGMVVFVILLVFMTIPPVHYGVSADLPKVSHPVAMRGMLREDAIRITILRNGQVYFGTDRIRSGDVTQKLQDRLKDREVEHKVYITADMRAHWGAVEEVLDGVSSAGIVRVAFLANQGQMPKLTY